MKKRGRSEAQGLVRNVSRARMQIISGPVDSAFRTGFQRSLSFTRQASCGLWPAIQLNKERVRIS